MLLFLLYWGNTNVKLTKHSLSFSRLPAAFDGFTVAQLSDLHNAEFGEGQRRLLDCVREANADAIVITGDTIDSRHTDVALAIDTIERLCGLAPVYLVTGNHEARIPTDCDALLTGAAQVGAVVLRNEAAEIVQNGEKMRIAGADDLGFYVSTLGMEDGKASMRAKLAELTAEETFTILLSHRPELYTWYAETGADLVFAGHAHGGQVRLPWIGGLVAPGQGLLPKYTDGIHMIQNTAMVISRGLGNSVLPLRINNPPEVVVVTLRCE